MDEDEIRAISNTNLAQLGLNKVRYFHRVKLSLSILVLLLAGIVYSGYLFNIEKFYRILPNGAATHELTVITIGLIALAVISVRVYRQTYFSVLFSGAAGMLASLRLAEILCERSIISSRLPFADLAEAAIARGLSHEMGWNTALGVVSLSLAILLRQKLPKLSFFIGAIAPAMVVMSLASYSYAVMSSLHGDMSLTTVTLMFLLSLACLMDWSHYRFLRGFFLPTRVCFVSRVQVLTVVLVPWLFGVIFIILGNSEQPYLLAIYTTTISFVFVSMIFVAAFEFEKIDRKTRSYQREMFKRSITDKLTGCLNRYGSSTLAEHAFEKAKRDRHHLHMLMIDIDDFKMVNDNYGHNQGDEVLKSIAELIKDSLRRSDLLIRWGGEEFLVILEGCSNDSADTVAEKIRQRIAEAEFFDHKGQKFHLSVSVGIATYSNEVEDYLTLIKHADEAMYQAKNQGKNRVIVDV
jgi:diguanylate cyclase (GGDEF)-like protein